MIDIDNRFDTTPQEGYNGKSSPKIDLDADNLKLSISGTSYPEDAYEFYKPVLEWLDSLPQTLSDELRCNFSFNFVSSTSHKMLFEIFVKLRSLYIDGNKVTIHWHYDEEDEDIMDMGSEFEMLVKIPVKLVPIPAEHE